MADILPIFHLLFPFFFCAYAEYCIQFLTAERSRPMTDQAGATAPEGATAHLGEVLVKQPGEAISYWQPVPANGHIDVIFFPRYGADGVSHRLWNPDRAAGRLCARACP
ncbi:hypothetical protein ACFSKM_22750 [Ancylobacter dichloromethanicus]